MSGGASGDRSRQTVILFSVSRKNKFRYFRIKKKECSGVSRQSKEKNNSRTCIQSKIHDNGGQNNFFLFSGLVREKPASLCSNVAKVFPEKL